MGFIQVIFSKLILTVQVTESNVKWIHLSIIEVKGMV